MRDVLMKGISLVINGGIITYSQLQKQHKDDGKSSWDQQRDDGCVHSVVCEFDCVGVCFCVLVVVGVRARPAASDHRADVKTKE